MRGSRPAAAGATDHVAAPELWVAAPGPPAPRPGALVVAGRDAAPGPALIQVPFDDAARAAGRAAAADRPSRPSATAVSVRGLVDELRFTRVALDGAGRRIGRGDEDASSAIAALGRVQARPGSSPGTRRAVGAESPCPFGRGTRPRTAVRLSGRVSIAERLIRPTVRSPSQSPIWAQRSTTTQRSPSSRAGARDRGGPAAVRRGRSRSGRPAS